MTKPGYDVFYTQIMYSKQFTKHCQMWKEVLFSIFKWKMDTPLFETKQALDLFALHWMVFRPNDISSPINKGWSVRLWIHSFMEAWLMFIFKIYIYIYIYIERERERERFHKNYKKRSRTKSREDRARKSSSYSKFH